MLKLKITARVSRIITTVGVIAAMMSCAANRTDLYPSYLQTDAGKQGSTPMELNIIDTLPGSPAPHDIFEPHMPSVDVLSDMAALFAMARAQTAADNTGNPRQVGARHVVVITPGRILLSAPMPDPERTPADLVKHAKSVLGTDQALSIAVVAYTTLEAMMEKGGNPSAQSMNRSIPFLGHLMAFAYAVSFR
jgi:hypothetical protein